ncbi:MAG: alkaline phosphatase family protein, partial [Sphaerochaetaceae bacterium]|nr:alkaline phosphatase family protein [Sphaerochaetaceae bacterium]
MKKESVHLSIFIDALGWKLLQNHHFLDDELVHKQDLRTIFGYSATCDPTILTGALPRRHGHFSFYAYDPEHSPFKGSLFIQLMRLVPKALSSRNRVRNIAGRIIRRRLNYTGYFNIYNMPFRLLPLFDYTEKKDLYQKGGINSGLPTIMDYARENSVDFFLADWKAGEVENLENLKDALADEKRNVTFAYLYMASMDAILHKYGTVHPEVDRK